MPTSYPLDTIAKLLDLTPRRVQQLTAENVIPKTERGQYDLVGAVKGYIKFLRDAAAASDGSDYTRHRSRLTSARADMAEMTREQLRKELIPADDIETAWTTVVAMMRSRLLGIPAKLAPRMLSIKDTNVAREIIEEQIHEALRELATVTIEVVTPLGPSDVGEAGGLGDEAVEPASEADDF